MKLFQLAFIGLLLETLGIAAFVEVSRTSEGPLSKLAVISLVAAFMALLLWCSFRVISLRGSLLYLPGMLALGYVAAFHLVGVTTFHGLLRDWGFSLDYLMSVLLTEVAAFALFAIAATILFFLKRVIRLHSDAPHN